MAITYIPRQKDWTETLNESISPYLQFAFQKMMEQKFQERQRQQNLQQAQTMFPEAFTPTLNAAGQQKYNTDIVSPDMRQEALGQAMPTIPSQYKNVAFNPETAQKYPGLGINFKTGEMEYKVPSPTFLFGTPGSGTSGPASTVPLSAEDAKNTFLTQNPQYKPEDIIVSQKPLPGGKGVSYFEASVAPQAEKKYEESVKSQQSINRQTQEFKGFVKQFDRHYSELSKTIPGVGETGIYGTAKRFMGKASEKLGYLPETTAFLRELDPKANQLARTIEGGRITDKDREVYAKSFANALGAPSETNTRLMSNALIDAYQKGGDISSILEILNTSNSDVLKNIVTQVNEQIGNQSIQQPPKQQGSDQSSNQLQKLGLDPNKYEIVR